MSPFDTRSNIQNHFRRSTTCCMQVKSLHRKHYKRCSRCVSSDSRDRMGVRVGLITLYSGYKVQGEKECIAVDLPWSRKEALNRHQKYTYIAERMLTYKDRHASRTMLPETAQTAVSSCSDSIHVPIARKNVHGNRESCIVCRLELGMKKSLGEKG